MIRVTFLGVGAALPAPGQTNCAYLIDLPGACILFDCGPAILQQLAAVGRSPGEVTHVFISHAHGDHALGWPMFALWWALEGRQMLDEREPPLVLASYLTWHHLRGLWLHAYDDVPSVGFPGVQFDPNDGGNYEMDDGARVKAVPLPHTTIHPVLGARFEFGTKVLAFTADTARCDRIVPLAQDADLLVHDARHGATVPPLSDIQHRFHTTARDAGEYAARAGAKTLALVHIGAEYVGREEALVAEARTQYTGHVFAPKGGDVFTIE